MAVAPWIVSDGLWERLEPLLPKVQRRTRFPGRKRRSDREALQGILFVLHTGIAWRHLPLELGFGSGSTCYRRLDAWQQPASGRSCTRCFWPSYAPPASWNGRGRSLIPVTCRQKRGRRNRAEPGRPGPQRIEAPPLGRRERAPARLDGHRRQPQRRDAADPARRPRPGGARTRRPPAPTARPADRRLRLRPRQAPAPAPRPRDHTGDRPPPNRSRLRARPLPLGRRTHLRLAAQAQKAARPLRPPPRDP